ncbi:hypothetical protein BJY00DRAFT_18807 [Aspergillus carlsbadensis]|nr:hypothetical protein BJY00DRAFT_18807 [Aspergillus carlsbadensis]
MRRHNESASVSGTGAANHVDAGDGQGQTVQKIQFAIAGACAESRISATPDARTARSRRACTSAMFIHYTGPSSEKQAGVRGAINAVVAANASLKRRRRRHDAKGVDGDRGPGDAGDALSWLNDRPLIVLQAQGQEGAEGPAGAREKLIMATGGSSQSSLGPETTQEALDEEFYLWEGTIQRSLGDGVTYPTPKQPYYPALLFQR